MRIALIGYGKMGRTIEKIALRRDHLIHVTIDSYDDWQKKQGELVGCDVAIEFSIPSIAVENIYRCFNSGVPVVCGTTGWYSRLDEVRQACDAGGHSLIYAQNFSIGMNIFMAVAARSARLMSKHPAYATSIQETHHIHKIDRPSGTAILLAQQIIENHDAYSGWSMDNTDDPHTLSIRSFREGEVPGTHEIVFESDEDVLRFAHEARNRDGFAIGAVMAAEWISSRKGFHHISEMLETD